MEGQSMVHDIALLDPGLVQNSSQAEHCVHACFQMIFRSRIGGGVPSFADLDQLMFKEPGKYTWEHGLIARMPDLGFDSTVIWQFDLAGLAEDPESCLLEHYGEETGRENIDNSNLETVRRGAQELLQSDVSVEHRQPEFTDIFTLLTEGYYVMVAVNQRTLQADPGYVAHNVLLHGAGPRGVRIHNPGPPATANSKLAWDLFDRAWSFPTKRSRNIMAFRPRPV